MLYALIALTKFTGYLPYLHTTVDMEAVDLTTVFWQPHHTSLQALHDIKGRKDGFRGRHLAAHTFDIVLILLIVGMTAVIVIDQISCNGIDSGRQGDFGDHLVGGKQSEEDVLNDIFRQTTVTQTAAGKGQQLVAVSNVIIDYKLLHVKRP